MASPGKISKHQKVVETKNPFYIFSGFFDPSPSIDTSQFRRRCYVNAAFIGSVHLSDTF